MTIFLEHVDILSHDDPIPSPNPNPNHEQNNTISPNPNSNITTWIKGRMLVLLPKIDKFSI